VSDATRVRDRRDYLELVARRLADEGFTVARSAVVGDYTLDPVWSIITQSNGTIAIASDLGFTNALQMYTLNGGSSLRMDTPLNKTTGTWRWRAYTQVAGAQQGDAYVRYKFFLDGSGNGYSLSFFSGPGVDSDKMRLTFSREDAYSPTSLGTLSTVRADNLDKTIEWRITRSDAGSFEIFRDGVSLGTIVDSTYTAPTVFQVFVSAQLGTVAARTDLDDIYFSYEQDGTGTVSTTMTFETGELDLLAAPATWVPIKLTETLDGWPKTLTTNVASISGGPYDGALALDGTNTPTSALKRYVKIVYQTVGATVDSAPELDLLALRWRGSDLFIQSADFTGLSCLEAIKQLAVLGGMETGAKGDGTFFFRNKSVTGTYDLDLSQSNAIISVTDYSSGFRDVRPIAEVRYGKSGSDGYYFADYDASDAGEASPTTAERFGDKTIKLSLQRFIFSNGAAVADAIAQKLYEDNYRPKRRLKIKCRIIPQLDLSDKVQINFHTSRLIESGVFGDPLQVYPPTGGDGDTLARDILMKVVGHTIDIIKKVSTLDLEEILS